MDRGFHRKPRTPLRMYTSESTRTGARVRVCTCACMCACARVRVCTFRERVGVCTLLVRGTAKAEGVAFLEAGAAVLLRHLEITVGLGDLLPDTLKELVVGLLASFDRALASDSFMI